MFVCAAMRKHSSLFSSLLFTPRVRGALAKRSPKTPPHARNLKFRSPKPSAQIRKVGRKLKCFRDQRSALNAPELDSPTVPEKVAAKPRRNNGIAMLQQALQASQDKIKTLVAEVGSLAREMEVSHSAKWKLHEEVKVWMKQALDAEHSLNCIRDRERRVRLSLVGIEMK